MAAYVRTPSALTWLCVNHLIDGLHKQISCKNCLYAVNSYFTIVFKVNIYSAWFLDIKVYSYQLVFKKKISTCGPQMGHIQIVL